MAGRRRTVVLFSDATVVTETPPLRASWSRAGAPAEVPVTGNRGRRVVFAALNVGSGAVRVDDAGQWNGESFRGQLRAIRRTWRDWRGVLFLDRGSPHTAAASRTLAAELGVEVRWLPTACPELNPVEGLWSWLKGRVLCNRQPDRFADTLSAATDFLGTRPFIDRERIGAIGICGSGGFVISAAKIDPRLKAVATVSMYDMRAVTRNGYNKSQALEQRKEMIAQAVQQRYEEFTTGKQIFRNYLPFELPEDADPVTAMYYNFYRTPRGLHVPEGRIPELTQNRTLAGEIKFMNFYPFNNIETISPRPLLFIAGDQAHSREFSEDAYQRAAEPKELFWVKGANHVDLYDRVNLILFDKLTAFFSTHLAPVATDASLSGRRWRTMTPYVICHMLSSVDGKIDGAALRAVTGEGEYEATGATLNGDAWVCGRTTMQQHFAEDEPFIPASDTPAGPRPAFVARRADSYAVSVDTLGKLRWGAATSTATTSSAS